MKKTRKLLLLLAVVCTLLVCYMVSASASYEGDGTETEGYFTYSPTYYTVNDDGTSIPAGYAEIIGVDASISGDIVIPDTLGGIPVTHIGRNAFENCTNISSITISTGVESIDDYAFKGCQGLTNISIPDSVTIIGEYAFEGCTGLPSVVIPSSVKTIDYGAFYNCTGLMKVTINSGVEYIRAYAFYDCTRLFTITIPNSLISIGSEAFYNTAYYNNSSKWDNGALYIGNHLIEVDDSVSGAYTIREGTKSIATCAFGSCVDLTGVTIPDSVESIAAGAFGGCESLTSITIPNSVTSIGETAFIHCTNLESVTISDSLTSVGQSILDYTAYYNNSSNWDNGALYIGNYLIEFDKSISSTCIIKEGTKIIADSVFYNCTGLTSVTIPDSVTRIGNNAFYDCSGLTSITIPDSVTSIGSYAFYGCTGLTKLSVPVNFIDDTEDYLFGNCVSLEDITLTSSIKQKMPDFEDLDLVGGPRNTPWYDSDSTNIKITISENITSIGRGVFHVGIGITSITIPDSVTSIGEFAFSSCSDLESITIPDSVTSIGERAFRGTPYYYDKSNWDNDVFYIGDCLLEANTDISGSYTIKEGTRVIADNAFYNCTGLTSVTIPDSVTNVGNNVFYNTAYYNDYSNWEEGVLYIDNHLIRAKSGIVNYYEIKEGTKTIAAGAFEDCQRLTSVTIPATVTSIGKNSIDSYVLIHYVGTNDGWDEVSKDNTDFNVHFLPTGSSSSCEIPAFSTSKTCDICAEWINNVEIIHSFTNYVSDNNATCTTDGTKTAICDNDCGEKDTVTDVDSKTGHSFTNYISNGDATCTEDGTKTAVCDNGCGEEDTVADVDSKTGHSFTNYVSNGDATCTEDGTQTAECDNGCGEKDVKAFEKLGHSFTNYISNGDATCTEDGTKTAVCDNGCGEEETVTDTDSKTGHSFTNYVSDNNATCTEDGTKTAVCDNSCGEEDTVADVDSKTGHSFTNYISNGDATCTADGTKTAVCDNGCGEEETVTDTDSKTGHSFTNYVSDNNATCTEDGTKTAVCDNGCGEEDTVADVDSKTGHSFGEWTYDWDNLVRTSKCLNCDEVKSEALEKAEDTENEIEILAPADPDTTFTVENVADEADERYALVVETLESYEGDAAVETVYDITLENSEGVSVQPDGTVQVKLPVAEDHSNYKVFRINDDGTYTDMNATVVDGYVVFETDHFSLYVIVDTSEKHEHEYTGVVTTPATHTKEGVMTYTCSCGDSYTEAIEKDPQHHWELKYFAPTCTEDGYDLAVCACGDEFVYKTYVALNHKYDYKLNYAATHLKDGLETYTCSRCGYSYTNTLPRKTEHYYSYYTKTTEPTCTEQGYTLHECECGDSYKDNYKAALGHKRSPHGDWCDRCGATMAPAKPDTSNCSCNCHKTGFMGFIYKLQRFFWKLFKTNKTCACGTVHY